MKRHLLFFGCLVGAICLFQADVFAYALDKKSADIEVSADEADKIKAITAAAKNDFGLASRLAKKTADPKTMKLIEWLRLTKSTDSVSFADLARFMEKNDHWPRNYIIRRKAEAVLLKENNTAALDKWFRRYPPVTPEAVIKYADILMAKKEWEKAVPMLHNLWSKADLSSEEADLVRAKLGLLLDDRDYANRLESLLDDRNIRQAKSLINDVDDETRKMANVRLKLIARDKDARKKIKELPDLQQKNAGLLYDELRWLRINGKYEAAAKIIKTTPASKQNPEKWWNERSAVARQYMNENKNSEAYSLIKNHGMAIGANYSDAEWLAGWVALRKLKNKDAAIKHFANMLKAVKTPVSIARGEYWLGRAYEAKGKKTDANKWYEKSSQKITTIYGQLAAQKLGKTKLPALPSETAPTLVDMDNIRKNELFSMITLLQKARQNELVDLFATRLYADAKTEKEITALAYALAEDIRRPDLAVNFARRARLNGMYIVSLGYPVWELKHDTRAEQAIVLSIIRQESNFASNAISPAGARGLMQIMPATAKQIAQKKKKAFSTQMLNSNPDFNVEVGSTYFAEMVNRFKGSYILAVAAYNAGPTNVNRWLKTIGTPHEDIDPIDWIEMIPFGETRNYVQRVLENLHIYRRHLNYPESELAQWAGPANSKTTARN